ncbi:MAG TPA: glycosyltransferase [Pyrinomonadaceae bacterium]|nr:glycosyltransferase [Pyrinomonadaceae bacterium]
MPLKPNVLLLIGSFHMGGAETQLLQLARLLLEHGRYGVRMATLDRGGVLWEEAGRLPLGEIPEYPLRSFYDRNMLAQTRRFAAFLRAERIAVVHTEGFYTNIFGMAGAAAARVPARIAFRGETGGFRSPRQLFVERCAYRLAHVVHANSEAVRRQLIAEGVPARKIETIYNGLDLARVAPNLTATRETTLKRLNLPTGAGRKFVTIVANMRNAVKDHPTFLRAAARVRAAVPEAAFVLAGEGELSGSLQALAAELGLERDAHFIGRCEREQIAELLSVSDVCVLSSTAEGFSNSILEYMAAARPVVATDVGGAREAIAEGESGYLVAAGDDAAMAARLVELLRDEERARRMGARGREIVEQRFSAEAQLLNTEALYERALARAHNPISEMTGGVSRERA